ncbi:MAG: radical SAM protein [Candidatus Thermoplasmatota archaeon]|nr:radical SAM protein [Candidatus Thermoplasmatota archaeon]
MSGDIKGNRGESREKLNNGSIGRDQRLRARREAFGYLLWEPEEDSQFVIRTEEDLLSNRKIKLKSPRTGKIYEQKDMIFFHNSVKRADILSGPTYAEIYPTLNCNERCNFCYIGDKLTPERVQMSRTLAEKVISGLSAMGVFRVGVLGGEPFLYDDLIWMIDRLSSEGLVPSLSTNATVHKPEFWKYLIDNMIHVNIPFHSYISSVHAKIVDNPIAYGKALSKIREMIDGGNLPFVSIVACKDNVDHVPETIEFLLNEGVKHIALYHAQNTGFTKLKPENNINFNSYKQAFLRSLEISKRYSGTEIRPLTYFPFLLDAGIKYNLDINLSRFLYGTLDGRRSIYIMHDGRVLASFYDLNGKTYIGNLSENALQELWNNSLNLEFIRSLESPKVCNSCEHMDYCRGGQISNYLRDIPECPIFEPDLLAE